MKRSTKLRCHPLEDRLAPATFRYAADTATLTVKGADGDVLNVSTLPAQPPGYLKVTNQGNVLFSSLTSHVVVRNLVVSFAGVPTGDLTVGPGFNLGGGLTVYGATKATSVHAAGAFGGTLRYFGALTGDDQVVLSSVTTGRGVYADLGGGTNTFVLDAGFVGGNLVVKGGGGDDTVKLLGIGDVQVGGAVSFQLGGGHNSVGSLASHRLQVGKGLAYAGGAGTDGFDFYTGNPAELVVGGGLVFAGGGGDNHLFADRLTVGGGLVAAGGAGTDLVGFAGQTLVGGGVSLALGDGQGVVFLGTSGAGPVTVGGTLAVRTGAGADHVNLGWLTVGGNLSVNVGGAPAGSGQAVTVGTDVDKPVRVQGSVAIASGGGVDEIDLARVEYVGGGLSIAAGGGNDDVLLDDLTVAGATRIDLGDGKDFLAVDAQDFDQTGALPGVTTFGRSFTLAGGIGDDQAAFAFGGGTQVRFGGPATFLGGDGLDQLSSAANTLFYVTGNRETFETYTGPVLK